MGDITRKRFKILKRVNKTPTVFISLLIYEKKNFFHQHPDPPPPKTAPVFVIFRLLQKFLLWKHLFRSRRAQ